MLAVTEAALGVLRGERPHLARVSVALRVVPQEFDLGWVGQIAAAASHLPQPAGQLSIEDVQARLARLNEGLKMAHSTLSTLGAAAETAALKEAMALAQHLLGRLRAGWFASGLWSSEAVVAQDAAEVESVEDELFFRLRCVERATRLRAGTLPAADAHRLQQFSDALVSVGH
jgi:hypothetical protein